MKQAEQFLRFKKLIEEIENKKLNSAERSRTENEFISVPTTCQIRQEQNEPEKAGEVIKTQNTEVTKQIQNNIRNLWEE